AGIWSEGSGALALVAGAGQLAAGTGSTSFFRYYHGEFDSLVLNNAGDTAFSSAIVSPTGPISFGVDDKANWLWRTGSVAIVVRAGYQAPGLPAGVKFAYTLNIFGHGDELIPVLNNAGQIAFLTKFVGSGINSTNDKSVWSTGSGNLAMVARA